MNTQQANKLNYLYIIVGVPQDIFNRAEDMINTYLLISSVKLHVLTSFNCGDTTKS